MQFRSVAFVVFDGVQGVDVFGPADVFYFANHLAADAGEPQLPYSMEIVAKRPSSAAQLPRAGLWCRRPDHRGPRRGGGGDCLRTWPDRMVQLARPGNAAQPRPSQRANLGRCRS